MIAKVGPWREIISLPDGGEGAIQGFCETFSSDLFTGMGEISFPLRPPPGRNGFQSQLSLEYCTGNDPCGIGWALGIPGVSHKTSKGVPRY